VAIPWEAPVSAAAAAAATAAGSAVAEPGAAGAEAVTPVPGVGEERGAPPISRTIVTRLARVTSVAGTSADATLRLLSSAIAAVSKRLARMPRLPSTTQRRVAGSARLPRLPLLRGR
jgi:hypothetical protein